MGGVGGGFCARSVEGEGGGGGSDSPRVFLDRFDEFLLLLSPFCSFSFSSLAFSVGWLGFSCCFSENDLREGGGGSSTGVVGLFSSSSSSTVCISMVSMLKGLLSGVLGVSRPGMQVTFTLHFKGSKIKRYILICILKKVLCKKA